MSSETELMSTGAAARLLGVSTATIVNWARRYPEGDPRRLRFLRTAGGHHRIRKQDLAGFLTAIGRELPDALLSFSSRRNHVVVAVSQDSRSKYFRYFADDDELNIDIVDSGVKALLIVGEAKPRVLVLPANLAGMDGLEVCSQVRDELGRRIGIVLTGPSELARAGTAAGADEYVSEPVDPEELRDAIIDAMGKAEALPAR